MEEICRLSLPSENRKISHRKSLAERLAVEFPNILNLTAFVKVRKISLERANKLNYTSYQSVQTDMEWTQT